jgi:hypothetical protein
MQKLLLAAPALLAFASSACAAPESATSKNPPPKVESADSKTPPPTDATTKTDGASKSDPCSPAALGLPDAKPLELWTPPPGCSPRGDGTNILRSDDELTPRLECTAGLNHLVDFTKYALLAVGYTLSPAGAGVSALDDGKVVTRVTRQRSPCPGDPMPMPMNTTAWFLLPVGAERTFADKTCTIEPTCK